MRLSRSFIWIAARCDVMTPDAHPYEERPFLRSLYSGDLLSYQESF